MPKPKPKRWDASDIYEIKAVEICSDAFSVDLLDRHLGSGSKTRATEFTARLRRVLRVFDAALNERGAPTEGSVRESVTRLNKALQVARTLMSELDARSRDRIAEAGSGDLDWRCENPLSDPWRTACNHLDMLICWSGSAIERSGRTVPGTYELDHERRVAWGLLEIWRDTKRAGHLFPYPPSAANFEAFVTAAVEPVRDRHPEYEDVSLAGVVTDVLKTAASSR